MIAILHNIRSLHNVGSMFRTADGAGVEKLYLTGITPSPVDDFERPRPQLIKISLGAEKFVSWEKIKQIGPLIDKLKKNGYKIFALEIHPKAIEYNSQSTFSNSKIALLLGNEVRGLSPAVLKKCDRILKIPMYGKKESLNVSVAFGIAAYFLSK